MQKLFFILILTFLAFSTLGQKADTLKVKALEYKIDQLDNSIKEIRRDELNYRVEKDLLKETYSNNYERISLVITIVLGIIGLFGYLGLKDINTIKKEYTAELGRLNELKTELENKIKLVSDTQIKYEKEILEIIRQNEEQNRKIKTLEAINKISSLKKDKKYPAALEECLTALNNDPNSIDLLMQKGLIYSITHSYAEAVQTYSKILELDPENTSSIRNLSEAYVLNDQNEKADKLILDKASHFNEEGGKQAIMLLSVMKPFNKGDFPTIINEIKKQIDNENLEEKKDRFEYWNLQESQAYVELSKESKNKLAVKFYFDYSLGKINGMELLQKLENLK